MKTIVSQGGALLMQALFPIACVRCEVEGAWLCASCVSTLALGAVWACPVCHAATVLGQPCVTCTAASTLGRVAALGSYTPESVLHTLIHAFKYDFAESIVPLWREFIAPFVRTYPEFFVGIGAVVPVPLHASRFAERGFNQADHIARAVAESLGVPVVPALRRVRRTRQQATLSKREREHNVSAAFALVPDMALPTDVLLVDDVFTTGSTLQACARTLRAGSHVSQVNAFCLARG